MAISAVLYRGFKVIWSCSCKGKSPGNNVEFINFSNVLVEREELYVVLLCSNFGVVS